MESSPFGPSDGGRNIFVGQMPDITPAQIVAVVGNVIAVAVAFGVPIDAGQRDAILALAGAFGAILVASDAHLRGRRANAVATVHAAAVNGATTAVVVPPAAEATAPPADAPSATPGTSTP
jgi:hypothetical protein